MEEPWQLSCLGSSCLPHCSDHGADTVINILLPLMQPPPWSHLHVFFCLVLFPYQNIIPFRAAKARQSFFQNSESPGAAELSVAWYFQFVQSNGREMRCFAWKCTRWTRFWWNRREMFMNMIIVLSERAIIKKAQTKTKRISHHLGSHFFCCVV